MSFERRLARWRDAGLIDEATRARIEAYERGTRKPIALYALAVLGGGTVALGIVSIIAANWDAIPTEAKLACDFALGIALAVATHWSIERRRSIATEVLVTIFYGFTLASLALVDQSYQVDAPLHRILLLWSAATLPLALLGRSRYLGALVALGLATTHAVSLEAWFEHITHSAAFDDRAERNLIATVAFVSVLAYAPLSRLPWLRRERPEYARVLETLAWLAIFGGGFALQFVWYERIDAGETLSWALLATALVAGSFVALLPKLYAPLGAAQRKPPAAIIVLGWLSLAIGTAFARDDIEVVGAVVQLAWLGLFAWATLALRMLRAFNLVTALIALRILVVYFEVFGSLLSTGLGLVTGGALTLLIAWVWRSKTRGLGERLSQDPKGGEGSDVA